MESLNWMAWTWPTAAFFLCIAFLLTLMTLYTLKSPKAPRMGVLGIETTPGDRLFISLLGSAFIYLLWMAFTDATAWIAGAICLVFVFLVFRFV